MELTTDQEDALLYDASPSSLRVHPKRRKTRIGVNYSQTNREEMYVRRDEYHRGVFEKQFGVPTDVDAVWAARDSES